MVGAQSAGHIRDKPVDQVHCPIRVAPLRRLDSEPEPSMQRIRLLVTANHPPPIVLCRGVVRWVVLDNVGTGLVKLAGHAGEGVVVFVVDRAGAGEHGVDVVADRVGRSTPLVHFIDQSGQGVDGGVGIAGAEAVEFVGELAEQVLQSGLEFLGLALFLLRALQFCAGAFFLLLCPSQLSLGVLQGFAVGPVAEFVALADEVRHTAVELVDHVQQDHDELVGVVLRPLDLRLLFQCAGQPVVRLELPRLSGRLLHRVPRPRRGGRARWRAGRGDERLLPQVQGFVRPSLAQGGRDCCLDHGEELSRKMPFATCFA
ncbi:hypothetical protein [Streptomyces rubiginosohelvolus]|uniref:hypothetical protein n=1 Tax=Streptomyces rubiginosohelvolus TaxID=67362 RepID=UPI0036CF0E1F